MQKRLGKRILLFQVNIISLQLLALPGYHQITNKLKPDVKDVRNYKKVHKNRTSLWMLLEHITLYI